VVLAVAGKSVTVGQQEYTSEVRTDLVISSVLKGDTRERVISVYHDQTPDEDPASRMQPGDNVLAFLEPREAETGQGSEGYVAADALSGLRELSDGELEAYRERLEALAQIPRSGTARPAELLEWLVATTEDPATRKEAIDELSWAVWSLERQAEQHNTPVDWYAQDLRDVYADFLSAGGTPEREVNPVILAAFLTDAHRERLIAALLNPPKGAEADLDLYDLVSPWLDDADLVDLRATGGARIMILEQQLDNASEDAERQRLGRQLEAAREELRRQLSEALAKRR